MERIEPLEHPIDVVPYPDEPKPGRELWLLCIQAARKPSPLHSVSVQAPSCNATSPGTNICSLNRSQVTAKSKVYTAEKAQLFPKAEVCPQRANKLMFLTVLFCSPIVRFYSYTRATYLHTGRNRLLRTVVVADRFNDEDSGVESEKNNNNHDDQNDYIGRCLLITDTGRIDEVGRRAIRRFGRRDLPVVHVGVHIVLPSRWALS